MSAEVARVNCKHRYEQHGGTNAFRKAQGMGRIERSGLDHSS